MRFTYPHLGSQYSVLRTPRDSPMTERSLALKTLSEALQRRCSVVCLFFAVVPLLLCKEKVHIEVYVPVFISPSYIHSTCFSLLYLYLSWWMTYINQEFLVSLIHSAKAKAHSRILIISKFKSHKWTHFYFYTPHSYLYGIFPPRVCR